MVHDALFLVHPWPKEGQVSVELLMNILNISATRSKLLPPSILKGMLIMDLRDYKRGETRYGK